jgi:predicted transcriptional regulator
MSGNHDNSNSRAVKEQARSLVEGLPPDATWDDLMYQIYVRQAIEAGIADADSGRVLDSSEVRARFGLPT